MVHLPYPAVTQKSPLFYNSHQMNAPSHQMSPASQASGMASGIEDLFNTKKSVKYLTCYYWKQGGCKKTESECLYSHFDTGIYAERPRPLRPGGPSVAGRNAGLATNEFENWRPHDLATGQSILPLEVKNLAIATSNVAASDVARIPETRRNADSHFQLTQFNKLRLEPIISNTTNSELGFTMDSGPTKASPYSDSGLITSSPYSDSTRNNHERRLTVGAGRPHMTHPNKANAILNAGPLPLDQSLVSRKKIALAALNLDEGLCKVMGGIVNASMQVLDLGNQGDLASAEKALAIQQSLQATYNQGIQFRLAAQALLKEGGYDGDAPSSLTYPQSLQRNFQ